MKPYYQMEPSEVRRQVNGSDQPLTPQQVKQNQEKYGYNELIEGKKKSIPMIFLEQFRDFLVIILIAAAVVSGILGDWESTLVILVVIVINAVLGTVQTVKAEHSLNSLKEMSAPTAKVLRDGVFVEIPGREITVGDEVRIEAGDCVPADGRLIENASLKIDESALTGESLGVEKDISVIEGDAALGDRKNMVFSAALSLMAEEHFSSPTSAWIRRWEKSPGF